MHPSILEKTDALVEVCKAFGVRRLDIFGSASRGVDFDPSRSDIDLLADFGATPADDPYLDLKEAFERIFGRPVDLVDRRALEASRNFVRRRSVLAEAEPIYAAR